MPRIGRRADAASPQEVFQAIGKLRKEARDEIDRLIRFLDNHMELEDVDEDGEDLRAPFAAASTLRRR